MRSLVQGQGFVVPKKMMFRPGFYLLVMVFQKPRNQKFFIWDIGAELKPMR